MRSFIFVILMAAVCGCSGSTSGVGDGATDNALSDSATGEVAADSTIGGDVLDAMRADSATADMITSDATATDTGTTSDVATNDAPDAGGAVGDPCTTGVECAGGVCLGSPYVGGYCTERIGECPAPGGGPDPCPAGSACSNGIEATIDGGAAGGDFCQRLCTGPSDCRSGYSCCSDMRGHPVCQPYVTCGLD